MFATLLAVVVALVLGHLVPPLAAAVRQYGWFGQWMRWLDGRFPGDGFWRGPFGVVLALVPPLLAVGLFQLALRDSVYGVPALVFGIAVLFYAWGPRDLDVDVDAVAAATDPVERHDAAARLWPPGEPVSLSGGALVGAVFRNARRRWFGVLFWFLLLGPFGVAAYRLLAQAVQGPQAARLSGASHEGGSRALAVLEWPVAQLMALSMALVGNFDTVFSAWRRAAGNRWALELDFLGEAARAGVGMELGEEAEEAREAGLVPIDERFPELRDAMSVVWRMLLLWMAVLALMIIAGWVG